MKLSDRPVARLELSAPDFEAASLLLEAPVEQFLEDGLQDWQTAAGAAILGAEDPSGDDDTYWCIAFFGNMLWAATAFAPAGPEVALAWKVAVRASSLLGAAAGSNVAGHFQVLDPGWSFEKAKHALKSKVAAMRDQIKKVYVDETADWVRGDLINFALGEIELALNSVPSVRQFDDQIKTAVLRDKMRDYVLKQFLYPNTKLTWGQGKRSENLLLFMQDEIEYTLQDLYDQYQDFLHGKGEGKGSRAPFEPTLHFRSLPAGVQQDRPLTLAETVQRAMARTLNIQRGGTGR